MKRSAVFAENRKRVLFLRAVFVAAALACHYRAVFNITPAIALFSCSLALVLCVFSVPPCEARLKAPEVKILVVDDMETNLVITGGLLASYDVGVRTCASGKEAVEAVKAEKFDLILLDHIMPEMDGLETLRAVRSLGGWRSAVPAVVVTANASSAASEKFLESGFDDCLFRPIEARGLGELLEKWVGKRAGSGQNKTAGHMPEIDGVDTASGLRRAGGNERAYFEALGVFSRDAAVRLKTLKDLAANNMDDFVVSVHGLKGAAVNIGAASLAEEAALLEAAGRERDMAVIFGRIDGFMAAAEKITDNIRHALDARTAKETGEERAPSREDLLIR
jgi:CheY-like chemotaxis protein/HPt (histidine-containing phosphotransfer) domain-containing protein